MICFIFVSLCLVMECASDGASALCLSHIIQCRRSVCLMSLDLSSQWQRPRFHLEKPFRCLKAPTVVAGAQMIIWMAEQSRSLTLPLLLHSIYKLLFPLAVSMACFCFCFFSLMQPVNKIGVLHSRVVRDYLMHFLKRQAGKIIVVRTSCVVLCCVLLPASNKLFKLPVKPSVAVT